MIDHQHACEMYLNNALDVAPRSPVINAPGHYGLEYSVLARDFPLLKFTIEVLLKNVFDRDLPSVHEGWED
jgi:hypothetical protein